MALEPRNNDGDLRLGVPVPDRGPRLRPGRRTWTPLRQDARAVPQDQGLLLTPEPGADPAPGAPPGLDRQENQRTRRLLVLVSSGTTEAPAPLMPGLPVDYEQLPARIGVRAADQRPRDVVPAARTGREGVALGDGPLRVVAVVRPVDTGNLVRLAGVAHNDSSGRHDGAADRRR